MTGPTVQRAADALLLLVILTNFLVLGTTRLSTCIRAVAWQGALLGLLSLVLSSTWSVHAVGLAAGTVLVKAIALPRFLAWAIREASVRREVEPRVGFVPSLLLGVLAVFVAAAIAERLPVPGAHPVLLLPASLASVIIGLQVLCTRAKAVTQVVGYLVLENGIFLFGLTLIDQVPFLLEVGVLLDIFVGVFIMGIVVFHINREFDSLDSARLTALKE